MSQRNPHSLARILAAPWQQRRNASGLWGIALVVALCFLAPVVLLVLSAFHPDPQKAEAIHVGAVRSAWIGVAALLVAGWAMLVGSVLQQNHPTLARLVPEHPGQLRLALLVAWALASLAAAALPGFAFDAPLAWACGLAAGLALLAACLRWPLLWLGGVVSPFVVGWVTRRFSAAEFGDAMWGQWMGHHVLVTGVVVLAGASVLVGMVRGGGAQHIAAYESRQRLRQAVFSQQGSAGGLACPNSGWLRGWTMAGRPYAWWMDRLLARPGSPLMARLLVGLGPAPHWTSRVFQAFWFVVTSTVLCAVVSLFIGGDMLAYVLPWLAFSVLTGLCTPALQAVPHLRQTQREQALLALLPGVPRGARLNRWLAWQTSATFLLAAVCAVAVAWWVNAIADAIRPGVAMTATGGMTFGVAAALLPQVAWQWRHWARLRAANGFQQTAPVVAPILLGIAVMALHVATGVGYLAAGVALAALSLAYCAWRWWRMGAEPTAFPVGRLP